MKDIIKGIVAEAATEVSKKPIDLLCEIISNWLRHRFRDTLNKDFVINAEEDAIKNEIQNRCKELAKEIPTDRLTDPNKQVTTAALDSMLFCSDNDLMREMFIKIMVSTMDTTRCKYAHPSFPHILKQLSPIDAQVFTMIRPNRFYNILNKPNGKCLKVDERKYIIVDEMPDFSLSDNTPLSFAVLSMLGLIAISEGTTITNTDFSGYKASAVLNSIPSRLKLTPLGILFYKCCLGDEQ